MRKKKKGWILLAILAALLIAAGVFLTSGLTEGRNVALRGVSLADKPDGEYQGAYRFGRWSNTVRVHIEDRRITGIDIIDDMMAANAAWSDELFRRVVEAQDTLVDAVSGATVTSKAYLKAIEDALR